MLSSHGACHLAVRGREAVDLFEWSLCLGEPYDLVCLDIEVPDLDGQGTLKAMRALEEKKGIFSGHGTKIIMVTALGDMKNVMSAYAELCDGYLQKPISRDTLTSALRELRLIQPGPVETTG